MVEEFYIRIVSNGNTSCLLIVFVFNRVKLYATNPSTSAANSFYGQLNDN